MREIAALFWPFIEEVEDIIEASDFLKVVLPPDEYWLIKKISH
jgi:hypothetical protein